MQKAQTSSDAGHPLTIAFRAKSTRASSWPGHYAALVARDVTKCRDESPSPQASREMAV